MKLLKRSKSWAFQQFQPFSTIESACERNSRALLSDIDILNIKKTAKNYSQRFFILFNIVSELLYNLHLVKLYLISLFT
nr:MAG TPA: hypothetical protein [Inoviridae sp.]